MAVFAACISELSPAIALPKERRLPNRRRAAVAMGAWASAPPSTRTLTRGDNSETHSPRRACQRTLDLAAFALP